MMALFRSGQRVKPCHSLSLAVLALLATSPGGPALGGQALGAEQDAERSRALELANHTISEAEKLLPATSPVHVYYPESRKEEKQRAKEVLGAVGELRKADAALSEFLKTHPDDLAFLWTQVHLDFLKRQLPIYEAGKEAGRPDFLPGAGRDPMKTLDHILELDPNEPDAYFREAILFASPELRGLKLAPDFDKAIESARKAVDRAPENAEYREALANLLLEMGRDREAMDALQPVERGRHPAYLLLADWSRLPLPPGAVLNKDGMQIWAQMAAIQGEDYPGLRVRVYDIPQSAADIEAFYRTTWNGFRFYPDGKEEIQNGVREHGFVAYFQWQGEAWHLAEPSIRKQPGETGLTLLVSEYRKEATADGASVPVRCTLYITNNRLVSAAQP